MDSVKVIFIVPYPEGKAPSQRFRFEQYLQYLKKNQINAELKPFILTKKWEILYKDGSLIKKVTAILSGFFNRVKLLGGISRYDLIFIHREATPIGPPWFEFIVAKIFRKRIIYDFDDAIWLEDPNERGTLLALMKWKSKIASICRWSYKISTGNQFLAEFASQYNSSTYIIPTTIDTDNHHNPKLSFKDPDQPLTIGWTGTHSTLQYLDKITPVIAELEKSYKFRFLVIANKNPLYHLKSFQFKEWNKASEIDDLRLIDIGLMPLTDDKWSRGKCGFKLLQYMALEIASVASPVGVNTDIIENGVNGYIFHTHEQLYEALQRLLENAELRKMMGEQGRQTVEERYSVNAVKDDFLRLFSS